MALPQEHLKNYPILTVVPSDTFQANRISQPYFRSGEWRYKDQFGEHLLNAYKIFQTTELPIIFGSELLFTAPFNGNSVVLFVQPQLVCQTAQLGYNVGDRIAVFDDLAWQKLVGGIRVFIPNNGIRIPRRNGNRRIARINQSRWQLTLLILFNQQELL